LRLILNAHPELAVPPESHFLRHAAQNPQRVAPSRLVETALASDRFAQWGVDPRIVRTDAASLPPRTLAEAADLIFSAYASAHGKPRWGDKTPPYVMCIDGLASILPDARFVHLIRDGRDVAQSFSGVDFGPPKDPVAQAYYWRRHVTAGRRSGARLGPDRYLEIRYEDLVEDPERQLRSICAFVDLPFDEVMLRYRETVPRAVPSGDRAHQANTEKPIMKGIRDWRTSMASQDVAAFEAVAGDLLAALGYELFGARPPRGIEARLTVAKARIRFLETRTRLSAARSRARSSSRGVSPGEGVT
jgi:hypothetical protein